MLHILYRHSKPFFTRTVWTVWTSLVSVSRSVVCTNFKRAKIQQIKRRACLPRTLSPCVLQGNQAAAAVKRAVFLATLRQNRACKCPVTTPLRMRKGNGVACLFSKHDHTRKACACANQKHTGVARVSLLVWRELKLSTKVCKQIQVSKCCSQGTASASPGDHPCLS